MAMTSCKECKGQGGWSEDRWNGDHYTADQACESCDGTGEVLALCECGAPAEIFLTDGLTWICQGCKAENEKQAFLDGKAPVADDGAPLAPLPDMPTVRVVTPSEGEMVERMERRRVSR